MARPATETNRVDALQRALEVFDRARSWEECQPAQEAVVSLGRDVTPDVLAELAKPQPPDRFDLLLTLLRKWVRLDEVLDLATRAESGWILRSALAEALRYYADDLHPSEARQRERIASTLASLARDPHDGVRVTAVEAAGLARLATHSELLPVLQDLAAHDPNPSVREEAQEALCPID